MKDGGPYREGGESCASCVELARENGELRAGKRKERVQTFGRFLSAIVVGSMVPAGAIMVGSAIHGLASRPSAPSGCKDSAEIIRSSDSARHCDLGATVFTETLSDSGGGYVLVRCVCAGGEIGPRVEAPPGAR